LVRKRIWLLSVVNITLPVLTANHTADTDSTVRKVPSLFCSLSLKLNLLHVSAMFYPRRLLENRRSHNST